MPDNYAPGAGVLLWDFHPEAPIPATLPMHPSRQLFLVDKNDLEAFYEKARATYATVLLKPATRATLSAFLGFAMAPEGSLGASARSLRADRDDLLQCLIQTNLRLQEYDQERTNFIARAMHDFRAPRPPYAAFAIFCWQSLSER